MNNELRNRQKVQASPEELGPQGCLPGSSQNKSTPHQQLQRRAPESSSTDKCGDLGYFPILPSRLEHSLSALIQFFALNQTEHFYNRIISSSSHKESLESSVCHLSWLALFRRACELGWSYREPPELHTGLCPAALPSKHDALPKGAWGWGLPAPTSSSEPAGWGLTSRSLLFQALGSLTMLSKPLLPKSQLVTCKWEVLQGKGVELSYCHSGKGISSELIFTIWENMVSVFSFVTVICVVNLDYRSEWSDYAVKGFFLRGSVEQARCCTSSCAFHRSSMIFYTLLRLKMPWTRLEQQREGLTCLPEWKIAADWSWGFHTKSKFTHQKQIYRYISEPHAGLGTKQQK